MHKEKLIKKGRFENIKVISLGEEHIDACTRLDLLSLNGLWSKKQWGIELTNSKRVCIGIISLSTLLAMASGWIVSNELQITIVAVHPDHRNKGLGKLVLSSLISKAQASGIKTATLEVKESNEPAKQMYKSLGFRIAGKRADFYKDGSDALILWLD